MHTHAHAHVRVDVYAHTQTSVLILHTDIPASPNRNVCSPNMQHYHEGLARLAGHLTLRVSSWSLSKANS